ncbi:MAG: hypothetical protein WC761_04270 [Candidatus Paceibacterota bacterium]|jgi:hypothetical protein
MESSIEKTLSLFKIPSLFREVLITIYGLISLLLIFYFLHRDWIPEITFAVNIPSENRFEINSLILICSYVYGKTALLFSSVIEDATFALNKIFLNLFFGINSIKNQILIFCRNIKGPWRFKLHNFLNPNYLFKPISGQEVENEISRLEVAEAMEKSVLISGELERSISSLILIRILMITSFAWTISDVHYFLLSGFLYLLLMTHLRQHARRHYELQRGIVKNNRNKFANSLKNQ